MSQTKAQLIDPVDGSLVNADINASAAIAGTKISPDFGSQNIVTTGNASIGLNLNVTGDTPHINFVDSGDNPDFQIGNINGGLRFQDTTNSAARMLINADGHIDIAGNLDVGAGLDVTGAITGTGDMTIDTNTLHVDSSNNRVGIGTASPSAGKLHIEHGNELGLFTSGPYNFQAKFESTDAEAAIVIEDNGSTNDGNRIGVISDNMAFTTANAERLRIDSSGRVLIGHSSARTNIAGINDPQIQLEGLSSDDSSFSLIRNTNNAFAGSIILGKTRGGSVGSNTIVQNGDDIGNIRFAAADGNDIDTEVAIIKAEIDGTPGSNDTPGRLSFHTTPDGSTSPSERMRIDSAGRVGIKNTSMSSFNDGMDDLVIGNGVNGTSPGMTIFSHSSDIGSINFRDSADTGISGLIQYRHLESPPYMRFMVEGTETAKFTTHGGIAFGSDTAAANTLDDYEEGTFTPTLPNGGGSVTFNNNCAKYIKIGNIVHIFCDIGSIANHQNSDLRIGGFPFTSSSTNATTSTLLTGRADPGDGLTINVFDSIAAADVRSQFNSDGQKGQIFNGHGVHFNLTYLTN